MIGEQFVFNRFNPQKLPVKDFAANNFVLVAKSSYFYPHFADNNFVLVAKSLHMNNFQHQLWQYL